MSDKPGLIIPVDKPVGWTSFQVVSKLKWHIKRTFGLDKFKIGHAGTLDPLASGLLLVCVGSATRRIEELQGGTKEYSGTMVLGATTPCCDLEQAIEAYYPTDGINAESIDAVRQQFIGTFEQVPPTFSAVKVDGQRAYIAARGGQDVAITAKPVTVYGFSVTAFRPGKATAEMPPVAASDAMQQHKHLYRNPLGSIPAGLPQMDFHIVCSKGTYIRSIARDFGLALGSGAFLGALRRERIGDYTLDGAIAIDDIEAVVTADNPHYECLSGLRRKS